MAQGPGFPRLRLLGTRPIVSSSPSGGYFYVLSNRRIWFLILARTLSRNFRSAFMLLRSFSVSSLAHQKRRPRPPTHAMNAIVSNFDKEIASEIGTASTLSPSNSGTFTASCTSPSAARDPQTRTTPGSDPLVRPNHETPSCHPVPGSPLSHATAGSGVVTHSKHASIRLDSAVQSARSPVSRLRDRFES